jgi:pimeloyl-ACP methyl ester carboxylesterase
MTSRARWAVPCAVILSLGSCLQAQVPQPGKNQLTVRGQQQEIYFYPAAGAAPHHKVLFATGDGGWRGFAITMAEQMAATGYDVYGLDTRRYLRSFTGATVLTTAEVGSDFAQMAQWVRQGGRERVLLMGWSEGAGLGLAAVAEPGNRAVFAGLVAVGTPEFNILGWRWSDMAAQLTKQLPHEPTFKSADVIAKVSPLPLFMIASLGDEYVAPEMTRGLFAAAAEPKRLLMIDARDHKFSSNTGEFFRTLREGLNWIQQQPR